MDAETQSRVTKSYEDWIKEAESLFGKDWRDWTFKCVQCGNLQSYRTFKKAHPAMPDESIQAKVYFSCQGRSTEGVGCDWTLGGLFKIHTVEVVSPDDKASPVFEFAPYPLNDAEVRSIRRLDQKGESLPEICERLSDIPSEIVRAVIDRRIYAEVQ